MIHLGKQIWNKQTIIGLITDFHPKCTTATFICACVYLYFLCDVEVTGVNAVCEQILGAAALTGPKHTVVGLEKLTAGRRRQIRNQEHRQRTSLPPLHDDDIQIVPASETALPLYDSIYHPAKCWTHHCDLLQVTGRHPLSMHMPSHCSIFIYTKMLIAGRSVHSPSKCCAGNLSIRAETQERHTQ